MGKEIMYSALHSSEGISPELHFFILVHRSVSYRTDMKRCTRGHDSPLKTQDFRQHC